MTRIPSRSRWWVPAGLLAIAACVTVNIYFPAAQVEKTAEKIVGDVYKEGQGEPAPPPQPPAEKPHSSLEPAARERWAWNWLGPAEAQAEEATSVSNAAIRALKDQIAQRHRELLPYYQQGQLGITKDGYLEARDTAGLPLPQVAALRRLVDADNGARRQLYQEVARALNLKPEQTRQVEEIFAKQWRDKAQPGWWVQADGGQWAKK
ncbi:MAG: YdbL family protein [Deltaproteobacteria bacterium]|nr:YdbL family protein [Deltaproteobacteria bacterium]